jgi:hypothetical protein
LGGALVFSFVLVLNVLASRFASSSCASEAASESSGSGRA